MYALKVAWWIGQGRDRSKQLILHKAAKALDAKNVEIATLQDQKRRHELLRRRSVQIAQIQAVQCMRSRKSCTT